MNIEQRQEVVKNAERIMVRTLDELDSKTKKLVNIQYYDKFEFAGSGLEERSIYIIKISEKVKEVSIENDRTKETSEELNKRKLESQENKQNEQENTIYKIYDKDQNLIASVNQEGNLTFTPEYVESLKEKMPGLYRMLQLNGLKLQLPKELGENDLSLTKEDIEKEMSIYEPSMNKGQKSTAKDENSRDDKKDEQEETTDVKNKQSKSREDEDTKEFAKRKNIPLHNVLKVKENGNLYKDHPELEPNLYFYRDNNGVVRAEYIDENGIVQPSKYFEPSTTSLRQETVNLGDNGKPVTKEVPYQVMKTKDLNNVDKDIRDIRMTIEIDTYGYLKIQEARQGENGEWLSHDVEMQGRDYNSHAVNQTTSIKTRKADPDKQTKAYKKLEGTEVAEDGIEYSEMYLIGHADEIIDEFIEEGYQKKEATQIFDYMIGEEKLTEEQAKQRINEEIDKKEKIENQKENSEESEDRLQDEEDEGRTPWGDAQMRSHH